MSNPLASTFYSKDKWRFEAAIETGASLREIFRCIFTDPQLSETVHSVSIGRIVKTGDEESRRVVRVLFAHDYNKENRLIAYKFLFFVCGWTKGPDPSFGWRLAGYTKPRTPQLHHRSITDSLPKDTDADITWVE